VRIQTNIAAIESYRKNGLGDPALTRRAKKSGTGSSIDQPYYKAIGLEISDRMRMNNRSMSDAERNAQENISLAQTADDVLKSANDIYSRMRNLAERSADETVSEPVRTALELEYSELIFELCQLSRVRFYGVELIRTDAPSPLMFQTSADSESLAEVVIDPIDVERLGNIGSVEAARTAVTALRDAMADAYASRDVLDEIRNRLTYDLQTSYASSENVLYSEGVVLTSEAAREMSDSIASRIHSDQTSARRAQANVPPQRVLNLMDYSRE
jgi:flagellin